MIGLLYKDLLSIKKSMTRVVFVFAIYLVIFAISEDGASFLSAMVVLLSAMLVMNAFAYDEISKWNYYALSLPITKRQLVLSRYVLTLIMNLSGFLLAFLPGLFRNHMSMEFVMTVYCVSSVALALMAILLPLLFKFGTQKARIWIFVICMVPTVLIFAFNKSGLSFQSVSLSDAAIETALWFSLPAALLLLVISYFISYAIMQNKEL